MAYTQCYLQLHALTTPLRTSPRHQVVTTKRKRIVCKADKEDVEEGDATTLSLVSRRSALTALVGGAAAAGTQLSPAHAADALVVSPDTDTDTDSTLPTIPSEEYPVSFVDDVFSINRRNFPNNFVFGTASSAYQFEGAVAEGGRKPSIWDTFTHLHPEKIKGGTNGDVAVDQYHRFSDDINLMSQMNMDAYRLSISWSRILPTGRISGGVNQEGIDYYHRLIDELKSRNIEPYVTLFHWDVPQALEDDYGGFLCRRIIDDFREYAEVCFENFGNKVKYWITLNEPWTFSVNGYAKGQLAPGRCTTRKGKDSCTDGNSGIEPYQVAHNLLLAHAEAVQLYREKFKNSQKGQIGITHCSHWFEPYSHTPGDKVAARTALDFMLGWYMEPVTSGNYPLCMRRQVGRRLPTFREDEKAKLIGSFDFIGLNYYTANYAADARCIQPYAAIPLQPDYLTDACVDYFTKRNGIPIGLPTAAEWLYVYPEGIKELLIHLKTQYKNPVIYITENGMPDMIDDSTKVSEAIIDPYRIEYHYRHLRCLLSAIREGVNVKGYFAWSFSDNFEWSSGYKVRFGLIYVDYKDNLKRRAKLSAQWFSDFLRNPPHFLPK